MKLKLVEMGSAYCNLSNQPNKRGDPFTDSDAPYRQDVTRDGGDIARATLERAKQ